MEKQKYIIACAENEAYLEAAVNEHIKIGYMPIGGVSCMPLYDDQYWFVQAMLLSEDGVNGN